MGQKQKIPMSATHSVMSSEPYASWINGVIGQTFNMGVEVGKQILRFNNEIDRLIHENKVLEARLEVKKQNDA